MLMPHKNKITKNILGLFWGLTIKIKVRCLYIHSLSVLAFVNKIKNKLKKFHENYMKIIKHIKSMIRY